jgi:hypothetical protein
VGKRKPKFGFDGERLTGKLALWGTLLWSSDINSSILHRNFRTSSFLKFGKLTGLLNIIN